MPGVNLSQSMNEEEQSEERSFFDTGIILSLLVMLITGAAWGGISFYIASLDKKIAAVDGDLTASTAQLQGEGVDRVADFDTRLKYFMANKESFSDVQDIVQRMEKSIIPGIVLTKFEYNPGDKMILIDGRCAEFRKLAEQIMSLKAEQIFSQVKVDKIDRDDTNQIVFSLRATL